MCNINGPFKLCTCAEKVDRTKPHWILHRYLQSKEEIQLIGEFSNPDPDQLRSERNLKRRLNLVNIFDFEYEPVEGDFLELFLCPDIEDEDDEEMYPDYGFEFRKGKWKMLEPFERYNYSHSLRHFGKIIGLGKTITALKNTLPFLLLVSFLFSCDLKPIDYSKKRRKSSYVSASTTQTGRLRKAHARKSISTSKRAFKNRLNSRSYYNRNKNRRKLRKGD